jgi:hypothetical protein
VGMQMNIGLWINKGWIYVEDVEPSGEEEFL